MHPTVVAPTTLCAGLRAPVRERGAAPPQRGGPRVDSGCRAETEPEPLARPELLSP